MLPARGSTAASLADVMPSCLAALRGASSTLGLRPVDRVVLVVVDGLGAANLNARSGHARTLAAAHGKPIASGFPTTTAAALASITTGASAGMHGIVGYDALVPGVGVRNQLRDWGGVMDPSSWQRLPTLFEGDVSAFAVGEPRNADSGFTRATLRGATYVSAQGMSERFEAALGALQRPAAAGEGIGPVVHLYVPELDRLGHEHGWQSPAWTAALEQLDAHVAALERRAPAGTGILVTADHGMVDVAPDRHVIVDEALLQHVEHVAGEPRCLQLHRRATSSDAEWQQTIDDWSDAVGSLAWVATRDELVASGWLGQVDDAVLPRIGDLIVAARAATALYVDETDPGRGMIGQHGSLTPEELRVPLLRLGAWR